MNQPTMAKPNDEEQRGLTCPKCGCTHFFVVYTRHVQGGKIKRSRECRHCGRRVITHETLSY